MITNCSMVPWNDCKSAESFQCLLPITNSCIVRTLSSPCIEVRKHPATQSTETSLRSTSVEVLHSLHSNTPATHRQKPCSLRDQTLQRQANNDTKSRIHDISALNLSFLRKNLLPQPEIKPGNSQQTCSIETAIHVDLHALGQM